MIPCIGPVKGIEDKREGNYSPIIVVVVMSREVRTYIVMALKDILTSRRRRSSSRILSVPLLSFLPYYPFFPSFTHIPVIYSSRIKLKFFKFLYRSQYRCPQSLLYFRFA